VSALAHRDSTADDEKWECVDVVAVKPLPKPVGLDVIKTIPALAEMVLVNNSRLSVQPVTTAEWKTICKLGGLTATSL
jgi:predicted RNA-binding protein with PUA-like domain